MLDENSRKAFQSFLEPLLNIEPKGYRDDGLLSDKAIKQGLKLIVDHQIYTPEQLTIKLAQTEKVAFPTVRLKEFIETGRWPAWIDVG